MKVKTIFSNTGSWGFNPKIKDLPEPFYNQAINNLDKGQTINSTLSGAFHWDSSPEKHKYWSSIRANRYPENYELTIDEAINILNNLDIK